MVTLNFILQISKPSQNRQKAYLFFLRKKVARNTAMQQAKSVIKLNFSEEASAK